MRPQSIRHGDLLEFDGAEYVVLDILPPEVWLRDIATDERSTIRIGDLTDALLLERPAAERSVSELDLLSPVERADVEFLAGHLIEVITGKHPDHDELDPLFDPRRSKALKDAAKATQLSRAGFDISERTIRRKRTAFSRGTNGHVYNYLALVDWRGKSHRDPRAHIPDIFRAAIESEIKARVDATTVSRKAIRNAVRERVESQDASGFAEHPADRTLNDWITLLDQRRTISASAKQRNSASKKPNRQMWRARPSIAPGHEVQVDSSKFDVLCRSGNGRVIRATLVVMIDKRTRSVLASGVYARNKGIDLVHLLARALRPRIYRPSRYTFPAIEVPAMPWTKHLDRVALEQLDERVPFIYPQRLIMDNGSDYRSTVFMSACAEFGIDVSIAPPASPTYKAIVENFFDKVDEHFAENVPGYINRDPTLRARRDPRPEDLLSIDELADLFEEWITVIWQNRPHTGLRDSRNSTRFLTPNQMYVAASDLADPVPLPIGEEQFISLLVSTHRTIQANGIRLDSRRYDSEELAPLRGLGSGDRAHNDQWEIRHDPWDLSTIWVRDIAHRRWIACHLIEGEAEEAPFQEYIRKRQRAVQRALPQYDFKEAGREIARVLRALPEAEAHRLTLAESRERALIERSRSGMQQPTSRLQPAKHVQTARIDPEDFIEMTAYDPENDFA